MDETPNYSLYNWEQLQDARAYINRERYPVNFAALEEEMERRRNQSFETRQNFSAFDSRAPIPEVDYVPIASSRGGCGSTFYGWVGGIVTGTMIGQIWFWILAARLRASGVNPYGRDDWGFAWLSCLFFPAFIGSIIGLFIGLSRSERG